MCSGSKTDRESKEEKEKSFAFQNLEKFKVNTIFLKKELSPCVVRLKSSEKREKEKKCYLVSFLLT